LLGSPIDGRNATPIHQETSMRNKLLLLTGLSLSAIVGLPLGCDVFTPVECKANTFNIPVGASENSTFTTACMFKQEVVWYDPYGVVIKVWNDGDLLVDADGSVVKLCDKLGSTQACQQAAIQIGTQMGGVITDTGGMVADYEAIIDDQGQGGGSECKYYQVCDPSDFPPGGEEPPPGEWIWCIADDAQDDGPEPETVLQKVGVEYYSAPFTASYLLPETTCGFHIEFVPESADTADEACQNYCQLLLYSATDGNPPEENNCHTFIENNACEAGAAPGKGRAYFWGSGAGAVHAPLVCGPQDCCSVFGSATCDNVRSGEVTQSTAASRSQLTLSAQVDVSGQITHVGLEGEVAYSASSCGFANGTCPLYIESLAIWAPGPIVGIWPGTPPRTVSLRSLTLDTLRPAMGAHRPSTRELQIAPESLMLSVSGELAAANPAQRNVSFIATNPASVHGSILPNGQVRIRGNFAAAPGIHVSFTSL
jgi:hypothetical protein